MITIHVRPGIRTGPGSPSAVESGRLREPSHHRRQELGEGDAADPADLDKIRGFASDAGLDVVELSPARRSVVVWGTAAAIAGAFRVELAHYEYAGKVFRGHMGPVCLPPTIAHIVEEISGLHDGLPDRVAAATPSRRLPHSRGLPHFTSRQVAIPLVAFLVGSGLGFLLFRPGVADRSTARRANPTAGSAMLRPAEGVPQNAASRARAALHDLQLAKIEAAAWKLLDAGRFRDAQDGFLRVLRVDPTRHASTRGLVAVRRKMAGDDPRAIRKQVAVYQDAVKRGVGADEYAPPALRTLITASLTAAQELEISQKQMGAAASNGPPGSPAAPSRPADDRGAANGNLPHPAVAGDKLAPGQKPAAPDGKRPQPALPVKAALQTPAPQNRPSSSTPVEPQPVAPISVSAAPTSPAVAAPRLTPAGGPAGAPSINHFYMVRIGPLTDRDHATAIAKHLSSAGFPQAQVSTQTGYRVLSEPLPRQVAEKLAPTLAARGFRTSTEALTGDTVRLVFGDLASQKEAETLSGRIAAAGYDVWIREAPVYVVHLGPYPQTTVTTITDIVRASAPDTTVAADDVSSQPSPAPAAAAPRALAAPSPQAPTPPSAVSGPSPRPAPASPPSNPLYIVRIGPVSDHDRATAVAKQLSAGGFAQPQITAQPGYRVVSEPLPQKVAENLVATLAGRGLRSYIEPLKGDSVQLLFGVFASQKDAEALSSRVAAAGYDVWVREGPVYILRLGPYPQTSVNTITGIVKAGAPEATVATDPVSTP